MKLSVILGAWAVMVIAIAAAHAAPASAIVHPGENIALGKTYSLSRSRVIHTALIPTT